MAQPPITFHLETATVEFLDGGKARVRIWDPETDEVATFNLRLNRKREWGMTGNTKSHAPASHETIRQH